MTPTNARMSVFTLPLVCALGCATDGSDATAVDAATILAEMEGHAGWDQPEGWDGVRHSCDGTHGPYVATYMNPSAAEAVASGATVFPDGAILAKDVYGDDGVTPSGVAVMRKVTGSAPDGGDWYWVKWSADGSVEVEGTVAMCSGCHASAAIDYALSFDSSGADGPEDCAR
jgi:hypothetical protein